MSNKGFGVIYNPLLSLIPELFPKFTKNQILVDFIQEISEKDVTLDQSNFSLYTRVDKKKYEIIICDIPNINVHGFYKDQRKNFKEIILDRIKIHKRMLKIEGKLIYLIPDVYLRSLYFSQWRKVILENLSVRGIISYNPLKLPVTSAILVLNNHLNTDSPLLCVALNSDEMISGLKFIIDKNGDPPIDMFIPRKIDSINLDPRYYDPKYQEIEDSLQKLRTEKLGDIAGIYRGMEFSKKNLTEEGEIKFVRPRDIKEYQINRDVQTYLPEKIDVKSFHVLKPNDILITRIYYPHSYSKYIALITEPDLPLIAASSFYIIRCTKINPLYLFNLLFSETGKKLILSQIEKKLSDKLSGIPIRAIKDLKIPILQNNLMVEIANLSPFSKNGLREIRDKLRINLELSRNENSIKEIFYPQIIKSNWSKESIYQNFKLNDYTLDFLLEYKENLLIIEIKLGFSINELYSIWNVIQQFKKYRKIKSNINFGIIVNSSYEITLFDLTKDDNSILDGIISLNRFPTPSELDERAFDNIKAGRD